MKPDTDFVLRSLAAVLRTEILPLVDSKYVQADILLIIQFLSALAADYESAAFCRNEENQELRELFAEAGTYVTETDLKKRLDKAVNSKDVDFKISSLDKCNQDLFNILIDLHAHIETLEGEEARRIEQTIWKVLKMKIMRRLPIIKMALPGSTPELLE